MAVLVGRRAVADYSRRPLNLVLLVAVPVVLVFVWGGSLSEFSKLLGGSGERSQLEAATAGWAAAALAGLAGFFQVTGARQADRRLAAAGHRTAAVVAGRLGASLVLAVLAAAGGLVALAARAGITDVPRAVAGTLAIAVIYLAFGVLVGTAVKTEMNGALVVTLAWVFDVFFGPALGDATSVPTRIFPLHYPTLVLTGQTSGHSGPVGDVGWSVAWAVGLSILAVVRLAATTRPAPAPSPPAPKAGQSPLAPKAGQSPPAPKAGWSRLRSDQARFVPAVSDRPALVGAARSPERPAVARPAASRSPLAAGGGSGGGPPVAMLRAGMREYRRNRVLWTLLVAVPAVFIVMAVMVTPDTPGPLQLVEGTRTFTDLVSVRRMHAATMVPVASAFLAGLTGLFVVTGSAGGDKRLVQAGFRPHHVLLGRLGVIGSATLVSTAVAVAVSAAFYPPQQWAVFVGANFLIALTYAMIGVLVGPLVGRLGGLYLILLLAFVDVGLGQSVMFAKGAPAWGGFMPARGASEAMIDGAFTDRFDQGGSLLLALAWLVGLTVLTAVVFRRRIGLARR